MRILYDGEVYDWQAAGGINRYFASLIGRLPRDFEPSLLVSRAREINYPSHPNLRIYEYGRRWHGLERVSYRLGLRASRYHDRLTAGSLARRRFNVFHPTYYTLLTRRPFGSYRAPTVLTVWDMIHEIFPSELDPTGEHAERKRRAVFTAQKIICISENTKKDLLERHAVPEDRVVVTHLASDISAALSHGPEPVPPRPYYLYVGSRARYKNFDGLLRAFARAVTSQPDLALCVVGEQFTAGEEKFISELGLAGRVEHYGQTSDSHLAKLYRCSLALVYPSLYEGFGIPPLEAMACGTVAVVSGVSSLPEVVGSAGVLFDPSSPDGLIDILVSLPGDEARRGGLIAKGRLRAKEFSWDKTVAQTLDVYRSVGARPAG